MKRKLVMVLVTSLLATSLLAGCAAERTSASDSVAQEKSEDSNEAETEKAEAEADSDISDDTEDDTTQSEDDLQEETVSDAATDGELSEVAQAVSTNDGNGNDESTYAIEEEDVDLQIVFIGDSIFDSVRDETGIAKQVGENLKADVYNLAIGGTSAGLRMDKSTSFDTWTEPTFMGIVYSMTGQVSDSILDGYKSGEVFKTCDFSKTDYFIIEYGTNDFLNYIPLGAADYKGQYYFYFKTSLDMGINALASQYPDATIILCTPYYEEFWSEDRTRYIGDAHTVNNGYGTLLDYISVVKDAAREHGLTCLDMFDLMGIDIYNVSTMTVDGIHPSEESRNLYASYLVQAITEIEKDDYTTLDTQYRGLQKQKQQAAETASEAAEEEKQKTEENTDGE